MKRRMMKSKIHRAVVTDAHLHYMGSITIDRTLMEAADILPFEQVQVLNLDNGARVETYAIEGKKNSGQIRVNGAAARLFSRHDRVIIIAYTDVDDADLARFRPRIALVDEKNRINEIRENTVKPFSALPPAKKTARRA